MTPITRAHARILNLYNLDCGFAAIEEDVVTAAAVRRHPENLGDVLTALDLGVYRFINVNDDLVGNQREVGDDLLQAIAVTAAFLARLAGTSLEASMPLSGLNMLLGSPGAVHRPLETA
jgi:hypothetical protein